jgi:hypothetical protein
MRTRSVLPYLVASAVIFVTGLVLGAGKSSDDPSVANTASKFCLAVGLIALIVTGILAVIARRRASRQPHGSTVNELS